jgi:dihydroxyacetone kinase
MKGFSLTLLKLNDLFEKAIQRRSRRWAGRSPWRLRHCAPWRIAPFMTAWNIPVGQSAGGGYVSSVTEHAAPAGKPPERAGCQSGRWRYRLDLCARARDIAQRLEEKLPLNDLPTLLLLVGERLATVMGGSSGVLMSIFFTAAGQKLHDGQPLPEALLSGLAQMKQYGGADLGDRTLIDALQPALEALQKAIFRLRRRRRSRCRSNGENGKSRSGAFVVCE